MRAFPLGLVLFAAIGACVEQTPPSSTGTAQTNPPPAYTAPAQPPTAQAAQPLATAPTATAPAAAPTTTAAPAAPTAVPIPTPPPAASVTLGKASVSGQIANPDPALAALRTDFEKCYSDGLQADAKAAGTLLIALEIGKDGAITHASATPNGNLPTQVQTCIRDRAQRLKLGNPKAGSAIVSFTISLTSAPVPAATASAGAAALEEVAVSPPGFEHGEKVANFARKNARECYKDALRIDPHAEGRVSVAFWLDEKGAVTKVEAAKTGTLPDSIPACIRKRSKPAKFPAPKIAPTVVTVPVRLALKPKK